LNSWNFAGVYKEREVGYLMALNESERLKPYWLLHTEASHYIARFFVTYITVLCGETYYFRLVGSRRWDHELFTPHIKRHYLSCSLQWRALTFSVTL